MVTAATAAAFVPSERPRVVVAADGTLAAIHERTRIHIVELPSCSLAAEIGVDAAATGCDVAWIGIPPRLVVLSREGTHSTVHLIDAIGPRTVAEIRLESAMKLYAAVGNTALAIGAAGAAMLTMTDKSLTPYQFPSRSVPTAAGAAGSQFMVALPGAIEEWDPQSRVPKRRLKLPRPASITALGGSERVVWMTTQQEPARLDVIPLVNRGQPKAHDLPEPITAVASHPRSDVVACIGATSGRIWVVDLDGRKGTRVASPDGIDRADAIGIVLDRTGGVLVAQAGRALAFVPLTPSDAREPGAGTSTALSSLFGEPDDAVADAHTPRPDTAIPPRAVTLAPVNAPSPSSPSASGASSPSAEQPHASAPSPSPSQASAPSPSQAFAPSARASDAFVTWRERIVGAPVQSDEPMPSLWPDASATWRDDLVAWARQLALHVSRPSGAPSPSPSPSPSSPAATVIQRFDLVEALEPAIALLYAHHLLGLDGAAPAEVARVLGGAWPEALGRGEIAARGLAIWQGSRVRLAEPLLRALDELPPRTGSLLGTPGTGALLAPCAIVATAPLVQIARQCLATIGGAVVIARDGIDPHELVHEARAYGAAPLWRLYAAELERVPADQPIIIVVTDEATADALGIPRLA